MWVFDELYNILNPSVLLSIVCITWLTFIYHKRNKSLKLPPGSLGLPVIGETLSFMKALKEDKLSEWIKNRAMVNGVIFKTSVIGSNTVVITGRAGNKFILSATDEILSVKQPQSIVRISGKHNIFELTGERATTNFEGGQDPKQDRLTWIEIQKMKYTWRVAQELMRQIPPVFGNFRKATKDITFGGNDIPKGWQVFWEATGTHMNCDIFEDPKRFDPSRFENPLRPVPPFAYIPFGSGPRMCIGNEFARVEALVVIHQLVTNFEWILIHPDEKITREPFPYPSKGLPIKLISRKL